MRSIPGLKLWELDLKEKTLTVVEATVDVTLDKSMHKRVNIKAGCLYEQALNIKVAIKKFAKRYKSAQVWAILETIIIKNNIKL